MRWHYNQRCYYQSSRIHWINTCLVHQCKVAIWIALINQVRFEWFYTLTLKMTMDCSNRGSLNFRSRTISDIVSLRERDLKWGSNSWIPDPSLLDMLQYPLFFPLLTMSNLVDSTLLGDLQLAIVIKSTFFKEEMDLVSRVQKVVVTNMLLVSTSASWKSRQRMSFQAKFFK